MKKCLLNFCVLAAITLSIGCGSDKENYTWGDLSEALSNSYCLAITDCGYLTKDDVDNCERHTFHHLCELNDVCDVKLEDEAEDVLLTCVDAVSSLNDRDSNGDLIDGGAGCFFLGYFGILPNVCASVWDYQPEE